MKELLILIITNFFVLIGTAQHSFYTIKRTVNIEGYILNGNDTINGLIAIPVSNDEIDYLSLSTIVKFTDGSGKAKKYTPATISGFGLLDDAILGDYISSGISEGLSKPVFLKKLIEGKISLLEKNLDRNITRSTYASTSYNQSIDKSIYYLKMENMPLIKIQFNSKTSTIGKSELQKLLHVLPENFSTRRVDITIHDFISMLSEYNLANK